MNTLLNWTPRGGGVYSIQLPIKSSTAPSITKSPVGTPSSKSESK